MTGESTAEERAASSPGARAFALIETLAAFALMHVAFRSFRRFTELGQAEVGAGLNYSPGVVMILVSLALILLGRRRFGAYGFTLGRSSSDARAGLLALVFLFAGGALLLPLGLERTPASLGPFDALVYVPVSLAVIAAILVALKHRLHEKVPASVATAVIVLVLALPLAAALWNGRSVLPPLLTVGWLVVGAGIGEEVFFRGYVQSRLNEAFGRPFQFLGVRFGVGLIVASFLFGLVHFLNPTDYFTGNYTFRPWHGLMTAVGPAAFLREKTGSLVAPVVFHALLDVCWRMPSLVG